MDKKEILDNVARVQYLYGLKNEIRYGRTRDEKIHTESVAEHLYGAMILVQHFLPLVDPQNTIDRQRVMDLVLVHDFGEIETGDVIAAIQAMDVMNRLELKGVEFDAGLKAKMEARVQGLIADTPMPKSKATETKDSEDIKAKVPDTLTGPELVDYIGSLSTEIDHYQEVLSRG